MKLLPEPGNLIDKARLIHAAIVFAALLPLRPNQLSAQEGAIGGTIIDAATQAPLEGVRVGIRGTAFTTRTGRDGRYRLRAIRPGVYTVTFRLIGYQPVDRSGVQLSSGQTVVIDISMSNDAIALPEISAERGQDLLLDPTVTQTIQRVDAGQLRDLPLTTIEDAIVLQAGVVGGSFRGGRLGQESFVIDGLNIKNQLDASTSNLGINIPTFALEEANLITNAFSARYGQAISGVVTLVTRDGGDELGGHFAYETDRPLPDGYDIGLDRLTFSLGGPLFGRLKFYTALDARARIDDDPVNPPPPSDELDPRNANPWVLPHNSGEHYDLLGKLTLPVGIHTFRLMGLNSLSNNLLYEPELKYTPNTGPAQSVGGRLGLAHWNINANSGESSTAIDLRVGYFEKESIRGLLRNAPERSFGGFTFDAFDFAGQGIAQAGDSARALNTIPGYDVPSYVRNTPWGVPAFFLTAPTRGELARTEFRELKFQADAVIGRGLDTDWRIGAQYVRQHVETFTRFQSYLAVSDSVEGPSISGFDPFAFAGYAELVQRLDELSLTAGVRVDGFNGRGGVESGDLTTRIAVSPRVAVSTELRGATIVASIGRFAQAPDFQFLVDAAFEDTLRTGRSRMGNPNLGFETSTQYEFNIRMRPTPFTAVKVGLFVKQLDGLISSVPIGVDPDSSIFGNADFGTVTGLELTIEREFREGVGARGTIVLQKAEASASDAFDSFRQPRFDPDGNRIDQPPEKIPLDFDRRVSFIGVLRAKTPDRFGALLRDIDVALIGRFGTGLPYTRTVGLDTTVVIVPNGERLPGQATIDALFRRRLTVGGRDVSLYLDVRNLFNRRNVVAVRRDTGNPEPGEPQIEAEAQAAFLRHPEPIPLESPNYRPLFDLDGNGRIEGSAELLPLYRRAARDFLQPVFAYGPPRLVKLGAEIRF